ASRIICVCTENDVAADAESVADSASARFFNYRRKLRLAFSFAAAATLAGLLGMTIWSRFASSARGVHAGKLADCPATPNCVCSEASRTDQQVHRLPWHRDVENTIQLVREVLADMPRTKVSQQSGDTYFHVE